MNQPKSSRKAGFQWYQPESLAALRSSRWANDLKQLQEGRLLGLDRVVSIMGHVARHGFGDPGLRWAFVTKPGFVRIAAQPDNAEVNLWAWADRGALVPLACGPATVTDQPMRFSTAQLLDLTESVANGRRGYALAPFNPDLLVKSEVGRLGRALLERFPPGDFHVELMFPSSRDQVPEIPVPGRVTELQAVRSSRTPVVRSQKPTLFAVPAPASDGTRGPESSPASEVSSPSDDPPRELQAEVRFEAALARSLTEYSTFGRQRQQIEHDADGAAREIVFEQLDRSFVDTVYAKVNLRDVTSAQLKASLLQREGVSSDSVDAQKQSEVVAQSHAKIISDAFAKADREAAKKLQELEAQRTHQRDSLFERLVAQHRAQVVQLVGERGIEADNSIVREAVVGVATFSAQNDIAFGAPFTGKLAGDRLVRSQQLSVVSDLLAARAQLGLKDRAPVEARVVRAERSLHVAAQRGPALID